MLHLSLDSVSQCKKEAIYRFFILIQSVLFFFQFVFEANTVSAIKKNENIY